MKRTWACCLITAAIALSLQGCAGLFVAGAATGASVAADRRSTETVYEDQVIEVKATNHLYGDQDLKEDTHIGVTSINHNVLLTGEAKTEALRKRVVAMVKGIKGVRYVIDEIAIAEPASLGSRTHDTWITAKVKSELLGDAGLGGLRIKVVTERSIVYLMGLVTRKEGQEAADVAKQVSGVNQVVKVFEYTG
ncbi:MAG TPA: BON domain-containing protein [Gammaproteobacteria bacterium]|nr:BON domain-containing protein [Gammaproteobacteria bacterium]